MRNANELPRAQLLEIIIGLHTALEAREHCHACGGDGTVWQDVDGEAEPCDCSEEAHMMLEDFKRNEAAIRNEYLRHLNIDLEEGNEQWEWDAIAYETIMRAKMRWMDDLIEGRE